MQEWTGYKLGEKLYESRRTIVYRATTQDGDRPVILKSTVDFGSAEDQLLIEHEYNLMRSLSHPNIIKALDFLKDEGKVALVMEDFSDVNLSKFVRRQPLSLEHFFKIALQLIDGIDYLHRNKIVHRDIKPQNVLIRPSDLHLKILDFNISTIQEENQEEEITETDQAGLAGSLMYIAPEQTGKVTWKVDFRTDFYMLGVTLYEMISGAPPFSTVDPLELVYAHLAKIPPRLPGVVPPYVEGVIFKLMSKNPEERYQTDSGLKRDLTECKYRWESHSLAPFQLGLYDVSSKLHISQMLYGRQPQIDLVMNKVDAAIHGHPDTLFIVGHSGIGKSAFVKELQGPISMKNGCFISGKFDQFKRNIPYFAITQAFEQLTTLLLGEKEEKFLLLKSDLLSNLDGQGKALIDVIPAFERLLGTQPDLPQVSIQENLLRFNYLFQKALEVIVTAERPLVFFLDDLQWADAASLELISNLSEVSPYTLLIGAYRHKEIDPLHPLTRVIAEMEKKGRVPTYIELQPLNESDVVQLVSDSLRVSTSEAAPLAAIIMKKTSGNPFFINQFIKFIHQKKLLQFDQAALKWGWDLNAIEYLKVTDNVADLVLSRMDGLTSEAKEILGIAAIIGGSFNLYTLQKVSEVGLSMIDTYLQSASGLGLLLILKQERLTPLFEEDKADLKKIEYLFLHDKIQQSALQLIPPDKAKEVHYKIGRLYQSEGIGTRFEKLYHFNQCLELITNLEERFSVAQLNLEGCIEANQSGAYAPGYEFAKAGISLLEKENWEDQAAYQLLFPLHLQKAECQYLLGNGAEADASFSRLLEIAQTPEDYGTVSSLCASLYLHSGAYAKCLSIIQKALALYNVDLNLKPSMFEILKEFLKIRSKLLFKDSSKLDTYYPDQHNHEFQLLLTLIEIGRICTMLTNETNLNFLFSLKAITLGFKYGFAPDLAPNLYAFTYLHFEMGLKKEFYSLLELCRRLLQQTTSKFAYGTGLFFEGTLILQWTGHILKSIQATEQAYRATIEAGQLQLAGFFGLTFAHFVFALGRPLGEVLEAQKELLFFCQKHEFTNLFHVFQIWHDLILKLCYEKGIDEALLAQSVEAINKGDDVTLIAASKAVSCVANYFLEDYRQSFEDGETSLKSAPKVVRDLYLNVQVDLFCQLSALRFREKGALSRTRKLLKRVKGFARFTTNFQGIEFLLDAKVMQHDGMIWEAASFYEKTMEFCQNRGLSLLLAAAQEEAVQFYLDNARKKPAHFYVNELYYTYLDWGCTFKAKLLESRFANWLGRLGNLDNTTKLTTSGTASLDYYSIIKANQAISSEIVLENLLEKMVNVLVETSGAQRCVFLVEKRNKLYVQVEKGTDGRVSTIPQSLEQSSTLPISLILSVFRGEQPVVLHNLFLPHRYDKDIYFRGEVLPQSLLAMPIINQGSPIGVLYLENYLSAHAFNPQQLQILSFLSTQAAISLENARLYTSCGRFVPQEFLQHLRKKNITEVEPGDQTERFLTLLFCDIRGFTSLSESLTSREAFDFMNKFLAIMEPPITKKGGFIDKYIGDAIMALFEGDADDALEAAIEMTRQHEQANAQRIHSGKTPVQIGIALNSGNLTLGILGSDRRIEGTVIGDAVNVAARLEGYNKLYGTMLIISQNTKDAIKEPDRFAFRLIDEVQLRGRIMMTQVWEVLDVYPESLKRSKMEVATLLQEARSAIKDNNLERAKALLDECQQKAPNDSVVAYFSRSVA